MKKQLVVGTVTMFMALNSSSNILAADITGDAYRDAEQAVINCQAVSADEVRKYGEEYTAAFLAVLAQVGQQYETAFHQGLDDAFNGRMARGAAQGAGSVGYQRGFERGQQLRQAQSSLPSPAQSPAGASQDSGGRLATPAVGNGPDEAEYPIKQPNPNQAAFINRIAKVAQRVGNEFDLYPSVIIAQAALESNWGSSDLAQAPYHNLFGVKGAFQQRSVLQPTIEFDKHGRQLQIKDYFRWYDNDYQSLHDYAQTLMDPLYEGVHRQNAKNYRAATHALLGKYATDPQYDRKLNQVIANYQLTKYDHLPRQAVTHDQVEFKTPPLSSSTVHEAQPTKVNHPHRITWLSVLGGAGSAGAIGLLRKFTLIK